MPIPWSINEYYDNQQISKYDSMLRDIAKENNLKYLYMFDTVNSKELLDGLHPDNNGHQKSRNRGRNYSYGFLKAKSSTIVISIAFYYKEPGDHKCET
jgi:hypothetical protein